MEELFEIPLTDIAKELTSAFGGRALPESDDVSKWVLERERKVYLDDDIGYNIMELQRLILRWNAEDRNIDPVQRRPIRLYIMSYGGELDFMWSMIDTIQMSKTPVITINMGVAASAAALIFLAGTRRYMMPHASLIIHEGSAQLAGDAVKVMDQSDSYKKQLKQMKEYILERTEIPRQQLQKKRSNDWYIDAAYCLEHKACDGIIATLDDII